MQHKYTFCKSDFSWSYLHLHSLKRIVVTLKMIPHNTFGVYFSRTVEIKTVEITGVTFGVPPGASVRNSTRERIRIVVAIFCRELYVVVTSQRIPSISWMIDKMFRHFKIFSFYGNSRVGICGHKIQSLTRRL